MQPVDFFRNRIDAMINLNDPLAVLATRLPWKQIEAAVAHKFERQVLPGQVKRAEDTFPGNPFDGHILSAALEQATNLTQDVGVELKHIVVDLGFRGVDADNPGKEIIHRGRYKSLSEQQKRWLKRRTAVEPAIGHLKSDYRMDRCWLQGALGDALHAISCAAGYNLRWLMRAIARLGIGVVFLRVLLAVLTQKGTLHTTYTTLMGTTKRQIEKFQISTGGRKSEIQLNRRLGFEI